MIVRAGRTVQTSLLASTRTASRGYTVPTAKRHGAAAAALQQVPQPDFPAFLTQDFASSNLSRSPDVHRDMERFLQRGVRHTILPSPRPGESKSGADTNSYWFIDSPTQDLLAVMDACLHGLFDVERAKGIFDRMRMKVGNPALETRIYNAFLEAYLGMSNSPDVQDRSYWLENLWELYSVMESGEEKVTPSVSTYATILLSWYREQQNPTPTRYAIPYSASDILSSLNSRGFSVKFVVADRMFTSSEEAAEVIKLLSKTAVDLNLPRIVSELGQAEAIGSHTLDILDNIPEALPVLKATKQKKDEEALSDEDSEPKMEVPFNLRNLRDHLAEVCYARRVLPEDVSARQKLLEESVYEVAVQRLQHESEILNSLNIGGTLKQKDLRKWMWDWHLRLTERLKKEIKNINELEKEQAAHPKRGTSQQIPLMSDGSPMKRSKWQVPLGPYLALVAAERLSLITILEIMRSQGSGGVAEGMKTTRALIQIGSAVEMEYKAQMCRKNNIYIPSHAQGKPTSTSYFTRGGYNALLERRVTTGKFMEDGAQWTAEWTQPVRAKIGGILVECFMDVAEVTRSAVDKTTGEIVTQVQPAFYHSYEHLRGQKLGVIRLNPIVSEMIVKDGLRETLHPRHLPMLVKPKPWLNFDEGGYFYNKSTAMRYKDSFEQQSYLRAASEMGNLELVYASLDILGGTPWKINDKVFHVVLQVWNSGKRLGKLPPAVFDKPEPVKPEGVMDVKERTQYSRMVQSYMQDKANNHSERCNVNYKIEIARAFLGDTFYQPHNIDFRGRAYPLPPHLNHIGDDLSRGLLVFAEGKPLGERGLRWLKIHVANLYGFDKASFDEREQWAMDRLDDIFDSAKNPLEGRGLWKTADDPWQFLGGCMELTAALDSPNPLEYVSHLPVHQDGTCNGLQHYAALGGDTRGAAQVNLSAGDRPSDVYSHVGRMAEQIIKVDAEQGDEFAQKLTGKITRKIVKQTVMTTVYGVTFVGARDQILKQLRLIGFIEDDAWGLSAYLAKVVLQCIGDLFSGAKGIQIWLNIAASLITKSIPGERIPEVATEDNVSVNTLSLDQLKKEQMTSVVWTTPLGLPIVQPYRRAKRKQIMTAIQTVYIEDPNAAAAVNSQKQASAFPPNFVHSLDATHMMLTALECQAQGLTFASVHDSYWTHACTVDSMSVIIRDTFIALHSSDVLKKLDTEFRERYKDHKIPVALIRGTSLMRKLVKAGTTYTRTEDGVELLPTVRSRKKNSVEAASIGDEDTPTGESEEEVSDSDLDAVDESASSKHTQASYALVGGKFVNFVDLLPPIPQKGTFQVEDIKQSPYFFS